MTKKVMLKYIESTGKVVDFNFNRLYNTWSKERVENLYLRLRAREEEKSC